MNPEKMLKELSFPKWMHMLRLLLQEPEQKRYCEKIYRELDTSLSHASRILHFLQRAELVRLVKIGRKKPIHLTVRGEILGRLCRLSFLIFNEKELRRLKNDFELSLRKIESLFMQNEIP